MKLNQNLKVPADRSARELAGVKRPVGRPKGSLTKRTAAIALRASAAGITPLDYMIKIMREPIPAEATPEVVASLKIMKMQAAIAAAPYMHPRLSAVQMSGPGGGDIPISINVKYVGVATGESK